MQLIIRCFTLAFYSVLLFLRESAAAPNPTTSLNACQKAVDDLFRLTASDLLKPSGGIVDFSVIPSNLLIDMFYSSLSPKPDPKLWREPNEKVVLNRFKFPSDDTIKFAAKHPDERGKLAYVKKDLRGEAKIVCTSYECKDAIKAVKKHWTRFPFKTLSCLSDTQPPYISGSFGKGVVIKLPWHTKYLIFNATSTLQWLVGTQIGGFGTQVAAQPITPYLWELSVVGTCGRERVAYVARDGCQVDLPLPFFTENLFLHIMAAFHFFTTGKNLEFSYNKKRGPNDIESKDHNLFFDKIPTKSLKSRRTAANINCNNNPNQGPNEVLPLVAITYQTPPEQTFTYGGPPSVQALEGVAAKINRHGQSGGPQSTGASGVVGNALAGVGNAVNRYNAEAYENDPRHHWGPRLVLNPNYRG